MQFLEGALLRVAFSGCPFAVGFAEPATLTRTLVCLDEAALGGTALLVCSISDSQ